MSVHAEPRRPWSHVAGCVGFWLWALVGALVVLGVISVVGLFVLVPVAAVALMARRSDWWNDGPALLGFVTGAGLPLVLVAALQWDSWHHRVVGDNTPNPYYWGGVGVCLVVAGIVAYAIRVRRR